MGETSKGVVVALLVVAIVVSVFSTIIMVNNVDNKMTNILSKPSSQGQVSVNIVNPATLQPAEPVSGIVTLNIVRSN